MNESRAHDAGDTQATTLEQEQTELAVDIHKQENSFVVKGVGGQVGEITYRLVDVDTWSIEHTFVEPNYRGGNIARTLLRLVVDEARAEGKMLIPVCSYALAQFKRNPEYADVWLKR